MSGKRFWLQKKFKGALFDMDGVLLESNSAHSAAFEEVLGIYGVRAIDYSVVAGMRTEAALVTLSRQFNLGLNDGVIADLAAKKRSITAEKFQKNLPLAKDCLEVLSFFQSRGRLALVSSSSRANVDRFLGVCSATAVHFDIALSGDDTLRCKPAPDCYLRALEMLSLDSSETFVVEDSVSGVGAALSGGISVVGIVGTSSRDALLQAGALEVVESLGELISGVDR